MAKTKIKDIPITKRIRERQLRKIKGGFGRGGGGVRRPRRLGVGPGG